MSQFWKRNIHSELFQNFERYSYLAVLQSNKAQAVLTQIPIEGTCWLLAEPKETPALLRAWKTFIPESYMYQTSLHRQPNIWASQTH